MKINPRISLSIAVASAMALSACSATDTTDSPQNELADTIKVAAAFYPLEFAVQGIGGENVEITQLTSPGLDSHNLELTPSQTAAIVEADLVVYLSGFQSAVDEAVAMADPDKVLDVAEYANLMEAGDMITTGEADEDDAHDHDAEAEDADHDEADHDGETEETDPDNGALDPHFWLDFQRLADVSDGISERLIAIDPELESSFAVGAESTRSDLESLDAEFVAGLETCERREVFTSHAAFGYWAAPYDLTQISVVGIEPDVEPSGQRIAEVQELAKEYDATTIFFETTASDAVAESIAQDLGLETAVLDPGATKNGQTEDDDFLDIMRSNLVAIQAANNCG